MNKLRIGIIGCGGMAKSHASRFSMILERVEVRAVCDVIRERAEEVAQHLPNDPIIATDYRTILDYVDAVLVVLPHDLHHPVSLTCLNAGKHVLCEKPMANSEQECLEMIQCAQQNKRVLMVAYCMRFHPLISKLKELLDAKTYGECFQLSIWTEQLTHHHDEHWARSAERLGGGQLFSHGCHYIDLLLWFLGQPQSGVHFGTNFGTPWMEREGTSNVTIQFASGAMGYHMGTWGARGTRLRYSFHAHCTEGMIEIDLSKGQLLLHSKNAQHDPNVPAAEQGVEVLLEAANAKPTEVEMSHFIDCIEKGTQPLTDPLSSLEGLRLIWKLYAAEEHNAIADLRDISLNKMG